MSPELQLSQGRHGALRYVAVAAALDMQIVFLTGIWPPDVGGPATHGPDFARFLRDRGHGVHVVTMGDSEPSDRPVPVESVSRGRPFVLRYPAVALRSARLARAGDIVYATATYAAAAAASVAARRPLVVKLVSDPAYERARRYGLFTGSLEAFQTASDPRVRAVRALRTASLGRARTIVVPSAYLAGIASAWGLDQSRIHVLVNPAPLPSDVVPEPLPPGTFVFVGRLTEQKALTVALAALARVPAGRLLLVGDGPERSRLEEAAHAEGVADRVQFVGSLSRAVAQRYVAGARASLLSSAWENLPHSVVEALAVGTPVVATSVGGVPEVIRDGENGLLVPPNDPDALALAMTRVLEDDTLRERLAAAARPSVAAFGRDAIYARLESLLEKAAL
ncbi:MAG: glycosyltransferase family 4 protein [Actinomycetota bacterium]|nr:glycosyltransferase family 4 protein [Actinomycetota bacterium]